MLAWYPSSIEVTELLYAIDVGRFTESELDECFKVIWSLRGTPQDQKDWKNPDEWIPRRLSGRNQAIASFVWKNSSGRLNPRHMQWAIRFCRQYHLFELSDDGYIRVSKEGKEVLAWDTTDLVRQIDSKEGLVRLLQLIDEYRAPTAVKLVTFMEDFLLQTSNLRAETPQYNAVRKRLNHLIGRGFVRKERDGFVLTNQGKDYVSMFPRTTYALGPIETDFPKRVEFKSLYDEFANGFLNTEAGQKHLATYERSRTTGRENYGAVIEARAKGKDITDLVLLKLLPYADNAGNWETGAWVHIAPSIMGDLKKWFERKRWVKSSDWPLIAKEILNFVDACNEDPNTIRRGCRAFDASPYSKGFQMGMVSPILNALRPTKYRLINNKSRKVINYFAEKSLGQNIRHYPDVNIAGRDLIKAYSVMIRGPVKNTDDLFDMFSYWLMDIKKYEFGKEPRPGAARPTPDTSTERESAKIDRGLYDYIHEQGFYFSSEVVTNYALSLAAKPFVILTGISGTGKTKIAELCAEYMCLDENGIVDRSRIAFISVRPDWMDNRGLLGFYNLITEKYEPTNLLKLMLRAAADDSNTPYFAILDEMNLARVEQYFSDFLSCLETRREKDDIIVQEAINLHNQSRELEYEDDDETVFQIPAMLKIPTNLYLTGTVNIDETTHMFSPKVLDRASVIEFNEVNLGAYLSEGRPSSSFSIQEGRGLELGAYRPAARSDFSRLSSEHQIKLRELNNMSAKYNRHFGYRVANEIAKYMDIARSTLGAEQLKTALDLQLLQRVLPKLHGTRAQLEQFLEELSAFSLAGTVSGQPPAAPPDGSETVEAELAMADGGQPEHEADATAVYPRTYRKLSRMLKTVEQQGFVSFIE